MSRYAAFFLACIALVAAAAVAPKTLVLVLDRLGVDKRQDAQLEELEMQIRDLRTLVATRDVEPKKPTKPEDDAIRFVPIGRSPGKGANDALVTIVAFLDYQCPFCKRAQATLDQIMRDHPDVRIVVKHQPLAFHQEAFKAALFAECAHQQGRFWKAHEAMFADQHKLASIVNEMPPADWELDVHKFGPCLESPLARRSVEEEMKLAERIGARGTPTFFINGRILVGAQPYEMFRSAIERARNEAIASGIPAHRYYTDGVLAKATVF